MYFTLKRNRQLTKKPVNRSLQDGASVGIRSVSADLYCRLMPNATDWTLAMTKDSHLRTNSEVYSLSSKFTFLYLFVSTFVNDFGREWSCKCAANLDNKGENCDGTDFIMGVSATLPKLSEWTLISLDIV